MRQGLSALRQLGGQGTIGGQFLLIIAFCPAEAFFHTAQTLQFVPNFLVMDSQFIRRHAIAAFQTANQIESFQNLLASFRVVIFFFQQVAKLDPDFFHLVLRALQTGCQRLEALVQIADLIHGFRCLPKLEHGALFPPSGIYLFVGSAQGAVDLFRPQIAFPFSCKLVRLPRLQLGRIQFLDPALQVLLAFVSLGVFFAQSRKTAAAFAPDLIGAATSPFFC